MFDDEPYYEPTPADEIFTEASEKLVASLKESVKYYVESLKTENEQLKKQLTVSERERTKMASSIRAFEIEKETYKKSLRQEKLSELMKDFSIIVYKADYHYENLEKCEKCNENRKIKYKMPSGKDAYEDCECSHQVKRYEPEKMILSEFRKNNDSLLMWYQQYEKDDGYSSGKVIEVFYDNHDFEEIDKIQWNQYFKSEDKCKEYCDYLNAKDPRVSFKIVSRK